MVLNVNEVEARDATRDGMPLAPREARAANELGWSERDYKDARRLAMSLVPPMSAATLAAIAKARAAIDEAKARAAQRGGEEVSRG